MSDSAPRRILVLGASGLIGSAVLREALRYPALCCIPASRDEGDGFIAVPFRDLTTGNAWETVLREHRIDAVVNCVGMWRGSDAEFELIQYRVPAALALACAKLKLHLVQVSALGCRADSPLPYVATKACADRFILKYAPGSTVVYPSLVFGHEDLSSRFFMQLATLPVHVDLGYPKNLQPVHVAEVARTIVDSLRGAIMVREVECAGRTRVSVSEYLTMLREGMGLRRPRLTLTVSRATTGALCELGEKLGLRFINRQTWRLLSEGSYSPQEHPSARPYESFATPDDAMSVQHARLHAFTRLGLGTLWIGAAVGSWWFWPRQEALDLLSSLHPALDSTPWLAASCLLEATLGLASLFFPSKRLWKTQFWLTALYSAGLAITTPQALAHPLGMLSKNLCVLAAQAYLALTEKK